MWGPIDKQGDVRDGRRGIGEPWTIEDLYDAVM
jgi:hypothetical protein